MTLIPGQKTVNQGNALEALIDVQALLMDVSTQLSRESSSDPRLIPKIFPLSIYYYNATSISDV